MKVKVSVIVFSLKECGDRFGDAVLGRITDDDLSHSKVVGIEDDRGNKVDDRVLDGILDDDDIVDKEIALLFDPHQLLDRYWDVK